MILFKNISLIASLILMVTAIFPCKARDMRIDISEEARATVTEQKLSRDIEFLSDSLCGGRATGTSGAMETASWISRRFTKLGLVPLGTSYIHSFKTQPSGTGRNVIGLLGGKSSGSGKPSGSDKSSGNGKGQYIIIMASFDGLGIRGGNIYPGADSNASGVAALLSIAEMMSLSRDLGREYDADVIFVGLDAKYLSFSGSNALWAEIASGSLRDGQGRCIGPENIKLVLNIDQIGSSLSPLKSGRKDYLIMLTGSIGTKEVQQANKSKGTALDIAFDYYGSRDFTNVFYRRAGDQKVFVEHKIPAVLATSGITMNNNKLTDTLDNLDLPVMKRRIWLLWNWTERMAGIASGDNKVKKA